MYVCTEEGAQVIWSSRSVPANRQDGTNGRSISFAYLNPPRSSSPIWTLGISLLNVTLHETKKNLYRLVSSAVNLLRRLLSIITISYFKVLYPLAFRVNVKIFTESNDDKIL
jgi:hypothetical protein